MIEITDETRALWYLDLPGGNWTAHLSRRDGRAHLRFRFRWYKDGNAFESEDEKHAYVVKDSADSDHVMIAKVRRMILEMQSIGAGNSYELLRGTGTLDEFFNQFLELPFVHARDEHGNPVKRRNFYAPQSHTRRN